ncbi:DNA-directed RNA polymerase subunit beta [Jeotgalibaca dankookensis]|uniref:DNA-directed RNA polymerase subunit beta n=1 Tax=Jeotgalibaca dankookensis TaxID=708126 RepID=UPI0007838745|nr:DNA-directed RNA polymerase subunit beta [Jeotgalibaca dankookensis]
MKFNSKPIFRALFWIALFIVLAVVLFAVGLMIGYGVVGGQSTFDIFKPETWRHITDYISQ